MDMNGYADMVLGYLVLNDVFPDWYPLCMLASMASIQSIRVEVTAKASVSSQASNTWFRDFSSMNVDLVDDATFWFTLVLAAHGCTEPTTIEPVDQYTPEFPLQIEI
jgi:hypothetical protein